MSHLSLIEHPKFISIYDFLIKYISTHRLEFDYSAYKSEKVAPTINYKGELCHYKNYIYISAMRFRNYDNPSIELNSPQDLEFLAILNSVIKNDSRNDHLLSVTLPKTTLKILLHHQSYITLFSGHLKISEEDMHRAIKSIEDRVFLMNNVAPSLPSIKINKI